jgi:hypothetical protein
MDMSASALTGALRVGLQVVVARKRPVLEIYQTLNNRFGPTFDIDMKDSTGAKTLRTDRHRFQEIFIDLTLINIGGIRAENVTFRLSGDFERDTPRRAFPELFASNVRQIAPGQPLYLMRIDDHDLNVYSPDPEGSTTSFRASGIKKTTLTIAVDYDGPASFFNWLISRHRKWRGLKQYSTQFTFDPMTVIGDLPPAKYA